MEEITKDDLRQLRMQLLNDFEELLRKKISLQKDKKINEKSPEWLRSKSVRNILNVSPATLQNLRISGKIRFRKVLGSYYYNRLDLLELFGDERK